jgi:hypothetical protein
MSLSTCIALIVLASIIGNRIVPILIGLILRVPPSWLLGTVVLIDWLQIPFYYWLYENGSSLLERLPPPFRQWFKQDVSTMPLGRWTRSLGGVSVFVVSVLPGLGGGIWSAVFLAHNLQLKRRWGSLLAALGSVVSYVTLYWVLEALVRAVRYFSS